MNTPLPWQHTRKKKEKEKEEQYCIVALTEVNIGTWGPELEKGIDSAQFIFNFPVGRKPVKRFLM